MMNVATKVPAAQPGRRLGALLAAASIVLVGALGTTAAKAHTDVRWSVSIGVPALPVYVAPAPVYAPPPAPVVYAPPVYAPAPAYVRPAPVVVYGGPAYYGGYGYRGHGHHGYNNGYPAQQVHWDRDRDGVPDRYDRRPNDRHRY